MQPSLLRDQDLFRQQAYLGGLWCDADNGATLDVNNPATGEILGSVPLMGRVETQRAIEAAKIAWIDWRRRPAISRSGILRKWHDLMLDNVEDLGKLMTAEQGKPLEESKGEVAYAALSNGLPKKPSGFTAIPSLRLGKIAVW